MICWIGESGYIPESDYMTRLKLTLIVCLALFFLKLDVPVSAKDQFQVDTNPPLKIQVQTYPDKVFVFAGHHAWIAVQIILDPEWHIYGNPKGPSVPFRKGLMLIPPGFSRPKN